MTIPANRRQVIAGAGGLLAGGLFAGLAHGAPQEQQGGATVILQARQFVIPDDLRARFAASGAQVLLLDDDPVRMWRGQWAPLLARRDTRLLGATRWPELLMVQGLAAESRRHVRYQRLDAATGAMVWLIA